MNIDEIIKMFEEIEKGNSNLMIGYHLHASIREAVSRSWRTNDSYGLGFSDFLKALKDSDRPIAS